MKNKNRRGPRALPSATSAGAVAETLPPRAVLTITLTADGKIDLNGPLNDFVMCLGLMARAGQMIGERAAQVATAPPGFRALRDGE